MPTASRPTFLRHFGRAWSSRREPDLADMGTAFALDEAMEPPQYDSLTPYEATAPARKAAAVAPWRLWLGKKLGALN
jgi:hypothetical protein